MIDLTHLDFERPIVIAEIGGNHGGDVTYAYELAGLAAEHGADVVKFQTYTAAGIVNQRLAPDRFAHFQRFELPTAEWARLAAFVRSRGAEWMTSLWDLDSFDDLAPLVPAFKVGSGDFTNFPLLKRAVATGKPLIISTAMCTMEDVRRTVDFLLEQDQELIEQSRLALLQCTAMYEEPTSPETHLKVLQTLASAYPGVVIGYSNHFAGLEACEAALALGAMILEVHFTSDRTQEFRDHRLSVLPEELARLRELCERIPQLLGDPAKAVSEIEADEVTRFRRAVFTRRDIRVGETLSESDLVTLRPEIGIPAWHFFDVVGLRTKRDIGAYEPMSWDQLER